MKKTKDLSDGQSRIVAICLAESNYSYPDFHIWIEKLIEEIGPGPNYHSVHLSSLAAIIRIQHRIIQERVIEGRNSLLPTSDESFVEKMQHIAHKRAQS